MSYTTTITFSVQTINSNVTPTETIQLILEFTHNESGSNRSWTSEEKNLRVINYGKREMSYDLEDAFMVPGKTNMVIGDPEGVLDDLLFGAGATALATDKQVKVTKKINGTAEFVGNMIEDSIQFDEGSMSLKFDAAPKTDILNKQMTLDDENVPTTWVTDHFTDNTYYLVTDYIEEIFKLVNPALYTVPENLSGGIFVQQGWEFSGGLDSLVGYPIWDLTWHELKLDSHLILFNPAKAERTLGEVLKKLAIDFGCFTGMTSYGKAFFKQLFSYNSSNLQTVNVLNRQKGYRYGLIDYVKISSDLIGNTHEPYTAGTYTELENRVLLRKCYISTYYESPSGGSNIRAAIELGDRASYGRFVVDGSTISVYPTEDAVYTAGIGGDEYVVKGVYESVVSARITMKKLTAGGLPFSGTFYKVSGTGDSTIPFTALETVEGTYYCLYARDPINVDNTHREFGALLALFWFAVRGNIQNCRVDKFILRGISYDFLKDFNYGGSKYQPISMVFHDSLGITECEAIYLGEV